MENARSQQQPKIKEITFQGKNFRFQKKFSIAISNVKLQWNDSVNKIKEYIFHFFMLTRIDLAMLVF